MLLNFLSEYQLNKTILYLFLVISVLTSACGGFGSSGPGVLTLKFPGTEKQEMPVKSGGFDVATKTWSAKGQMSTSSSHFICVADFEIDLSQGSISLSKRVTDGQTKVCFEIDGDENTNDKSILKAADYKIGKRGEGFAFNSIDSVDIRIFKDGKEVTHDFSNHKTTGEIKITSASADSINGEINLTDGDKEIKGTFSAKAFGKT